MGQQTNNDEVDGLTQMDHEIPRYHNGKVRFKKKILFETASDVTRPRLDNVEENN